MRFILGLKNAKFNQMSCRKKCTKLRCSVVFPPSSVPASSVREVKRNRAEMCSSIGLQTAHETDASLLRCSLRKMFTFFFAIFDCCFKNDSGRFALGIRTMQKAVFTTCYFVVAVVNDNCLIVMFMLTSMLLP